MYQRSFSTETTKLILKGQGGVKTGEMDDVLRRGETDTRERERTLIWQELRILRWRGGEVRKCWGEWQEMRTEK